MGLTDSLECSFSCHDLRLVAAAGLDLYSEPARRGRSLAVATWGWTCSEPLSRGWWWGGAQAGRIAYCVFSALFGHICTHLHCS